VIYNDMPMIVTKCNIAVEQDKLYRDSRQDSWRLKAQKGGR